MNERTENILVLAMHAAVAFVIAASAYFALSHLMTLEPFGHDESVYLTKAREWLGGAIADQWGIYRPIGMSILAWVALQFSGAEAFLRLFGVLLAAMTTALVFLFFRSVASLWEAIAITLVAGSSYVFLLQSTYFLNDIGSSGLMLAVMWMVNLYYKSNGRSYAIFFAAPLAALAFYMRYGSIQMLFVIAVFSMVLLLPRFLREENADFRNLGLTAFFALLLFAPHFIYSAIETKEALGILLSAGEAAQRAYIGEGLVQYFLWLPDRLGGWPVGITAITGAIAYATILLLPAIRKANPVLIWIGSIGAVSFLLTGLLVHAEARYVYFPLVLLSGLGVISAYRVLLRFSPWLAGSFIAVVCFASVLFGINHYRDLSAYFDARETNRLAAAYSKAHEIVRLQSKSAGGCSLWVVQFQPRASWYTGCSIYDFNTASQFTRELSKGAALPAYSVVVTKLKNEQVDEKHAPELGVVLNEIFRIKDTSAGDIIIYRIVDLKRDRIIYTGTGKAS